LYAFERCFDHYRARTQFNHPEFAKKMQPRAPFWDCVAEGDPGKGFAFVALVEM
jgi:hypothetical protein